MILAGNWHHADWEPSPPRPGSLDAPARKDCKTAVHDGDLCIECWRDRRELAIARDREWWSA